MLKRYLTVLFIALPAPAFAAGFKTHYAGNNLIFMALLTGFALVALVQFGHYALQSLRKDQSMQRRTRQKHP